MIFKKQMFVEDSSDSGLVAASLSGNRDAFGEIVRRYQSLICSIAYSTTGSLSHSEDMAQETFVAAWKQLKQLKEPHKLRSWLCGMARNIVANSRRRASREPAHQAEPLELACELPSTESAMTEDVIRREEEALLWRSLESIPEIYREPLVLFYREGESVERVAAELELSEDAVKQRLVRGRRLLADQVSTFVEGALKRSAPGKAFTIGVLTALPVLSGSAAGATVGMTAAKGTMKAAGAMGMITALVGPLFVFFGTWLGYRISLDTAQSDSERAFIRSFYRKLAVSIFGFAAASGVLMIFAQRLNANNPALFWSMLIGLAVTYIGAILALTVWSMRARRELCRKSNETTTRPGWEYRTRCEFLGLPLIHIRVGGGVPAQKRAVKAWIAMGGLFAFGGIAVAPVSMGGCALGLLPFGGCAIGLLALGGLSIGVWSFGGLALGWQAYGGFAIAWSAAMGGAAIARDWALGGVAQAAQANNELARISIDTQPFLRSAKIYAPYFPWLNLIWVVPMLWWWRVTHASKGPRIEAK
jgi:RNA polymerase sigma factor (sigma-70 family)